MLLSSLRERLSYANVTATLALFVALGGSAYAATKIRGKDIAPRTITAKNVKRGTLTGSELARGAITTAKLSPRVRALLPEPDDFGSGGEPLPGIDGLPGAPGEPGEPGEPGSPGSGCPAEQALLCGDADLPSGQTATLTAAGSSPLVATAYRTSCLAASCVVLLAGTTPATQASAFFANAGQRDMVLSVSAPVRRFDLDNAQRMSLTTQTDRWQLALTAQSVTEDPTP